MDNTPGSRRKSWLAIVVFVVVSLVTQVLLARTVHLDAVAAIALAVAAGLVSVALVYVVAALVREARARRRGP